MTEKPAAPPATDAAPTAPAPAPAAPPPPPAAPAAPVNKQPILRGFMARIAAGEFDLAGGKDFHQFVVKEIYPLLGDGTLTADDLVKVTQAFSARTDPYNKEQG